jgi:putative FmdB family regulatory protein
MPTYEYHCDACGHQFDEFQSITADPLKKCPECKKNKLRRAFGTGAAVLFKGSGFYETDYRSESYKSAAKAEQDAATKTSSTDSSTAANGTGKSEGGGKSGKAGAKKEKS